MLPVAQKYSMHNYVQCIILNNENKQLHCYASLCAYCTVFPIVISACTSTYKKWLTVKQYDLLCQHHLHTLEVHRISGLHQKTTLSV